MVNLYFVPTPIGNLNDMTLRGVEVLKSCDVVYSDDVDKTKQLLSYYNIEKPLYCYKNNKEELFNYLSDNKTVAIVSGEGYSGVDGDSHLICQEAIEKGYNITVLPGANYLLTGLVTSGIPCDKFLYCGFLDQEHIKEEVEEIIDFDRTIVIYETNQKITDTIKVLYEVLGERKAVICYNLTKPQEGFIRFTLGEDITIDVDYDQVVIVLEGAKISSNTKKLNDLDVKEHYNYYLDQGLNDKDAMTKVAKDRGVSKSDIYKLIKI